MTSAYKGSWWRVVCGLTGHEYVRVTDPWTARLALVCLRCYARGLYADRDA